MNTYTAVPPNLKSTLEDSDGNLVERYATSSMYTPVELLGEDGSDEEGRPIPLDRLIR